MRKTLFCMGMGLLATAQLQAQPAEPLWMRGGQLSPDASQIVFSYMGDLYVVPASGGDARQLTTHQAYDGHPLWSPDGSQIAFSSDRDGGLDVYVMPATGGKARRVTTSADGETPMAWLSDERLVIQRAGMPTATELIYPTGTFTKLYEVDVRGGRQHLFCAWPMAQVSIAADGRILYEDVKGYEDQWRKHHTSSVTRDICIKEGDTYRQLSTFKGEDRNPVWDKEGTGYFYLSEQDGTMNVWHARLDGQTTQLTRFKGNPVRYLSVGAGNMLSFTCDGQLYTLRPGGEPQKVDVRIHNDIDPDRVVRTLTYSGATHVAVSPKGGEVAFVMNNDVYVTDMEYKTTRQITCTPERERTVDFRADGRAVVYDSERGGVWSIYESEIASDKEPKMAYCTATKERRLTDGVTTSFQPQYSPDGKKVAYLEDRVTLRVIDLKSGKINTAMDGKYAYSYSDGDQYFTWSPDSRWLLAEYLNVGGWNNPDIALVPADGKKEPFNLTQSGYSDGHPKWVMDGKAMIFASDRAGYRSHGSWGSEYDVYIMFFDPEAYECFRMNKEDFTHYVEMLKEKEKNKKKDDKDSTKADDVKPLRFCLDNLDDRTMRLTRSSDFISDAVMNKEGTKLYYIAPYNGNNALWMTDFLEGTTVMRMGQISGHSLRADASCNNCYFVGGGGSINKLDLAANNIKNIPFEAFAVDSLARFQAYLYEHIWRQTKEKLYDPGMNGAPWDSLYATYKRFLPHITNGYDFSEMASELLGELNVSHTGCRYGGNGRRLQEASLGVLLDESYRGHGLRVAEVLPGGPLDVCEQVKAGTIITAIDGQLITDTTDYFPLLAGKTGISTRLTLKGEKKEVTIRPISRSRQNELLYNRWVRRNEHYVDSISNGRIAYVHIQSMNSPSFRRFYKSLLSEKNRQRDAVVVDIRNNGGGWLHNDVCLTLSGTRYVRYSPRGKYIGNDPFDRWVKPSCMLVCQNDYSNAHGTPWLYKEMGIGKLVGTPVPGTMTAVWWESIGGYVFGIPQVGALDNRDHYLENQQLEPDIECYNKPEDVLRGKDHQLEESVRSLMK